jgi:hypothetical protein
MRTEENQFWWKIHNSKPEHVRDVIFNQRIPLDVNYRSIMNTGFLHEVCYKDGADALSLLLTYPNINVNIEDEEGDSPFAVCCFFGRNNCARVLLRDHRVILNEKDRCGRPPLWYSASSGHIDVINECIASGRDLDIENCTDGDLTVIEVAREERNIEIAKLLEKYKKTPAETIHLKRVETGWYEREAAERFALVIFLSDGLLEIKKYPMDKKTTRFFRIARRLPIEIQMVLCQRLVGSTGFLVLSKDSEVAFKELARKLLIFV